MKNSKKKRKEYKIPSREEQIKKYQNISPSQIFYNPNTIKWFKKKYNEDLIKKSIYSLFPNNCQPIMTEEEWTPQRILREFLTHYLKPEDKYKDIWINPKYFFSKEVYESILKLKEIFLQFDEDGSRKMEIDEMTTMFNINNINVTEEDLCGLFFKGKKYKQEDINKLYLDFFQFMNFALSKKSDQDFRVFMRNIKEKKMKEKEQERKAEEEKRKKHLENFEDNEEEVVDDLFVDEKKEPVFFPMNFNLLLDYFINKGKERKSQKKIRRAIKMMRNILTPGRYPEDDPDFAEDEEGGEDKSEDGDKKEKKEEDEYDKQLREINTMEIMEEFDKLFKMSYITPTSSLKEQQKTKVITSKVAEVTKSNNNTRRNFFREKTMKPFSKNDKNLNNIDKNSSKNNIRRLSKHDIKIDLKNEDDNKKDEKENKISDNKKDEEENKISYNKRDLRRMKTHNANVNINILKNNLIGNENESTEKVKFNLNSEKKPKPKEKRCMFFSNMIKKEIEEPNIEEMNLFYYNKYHSVYLARKATENRVSDYFSKKQLGLKPGQKICKATLPIINDKKKVKIIDNNQKSESVKKSEYSKLMDSFGFRRRNYKNQFLY
jgi:hypothetical protein